MSVQVRSLASLSELRIRGHECGVGLRHGLDLVLLWLWCRPAAAAPIQPLAGELQYAAGAALKKKQEKKREQLAAFFL